MATQTKLITVEELARMPDTGKFVELVKGSIIKMSPTGRMHGRIVSKIDRYLGMFVEQHRLGETYGAETGFILRRDPDTLRAPDVAFVGTERLAQQHAEGFLEGAPDLAVEVISPSETRRAVEEKVLDYLHAGTQLIWLVQPETQTVTIYRSLDNIRILTAADTLDGGDLLPGFTLPVAELFA